MEKPDGRKRRITKVFSTDRPMPVVEKPKELEVKRVSVMKDAFKK